MVLKSEKSKEILMKDWLKVKFILYSLLFFTLILIALIVSLFQIGNSNADSARYMISALIQSEAAILAIVITLTLVVVQQSASSFSPRVIEIFKNIKKNPDFYFIIIIYVGVILYSTLVLKIIDNNLTVQNNSFLQIHIWITYFLAIYAFASLFLYIVHTLDLLKTSTIIRMLSEDINEDTLLALVGYKIENHNTFKFISFWPFIVLNRVIYYFSKGNARFDKDEDPILPLVDIIRGSILKYDYETIRNCLKAIEYRLLPLIENETFIRIKYYEEIKSAYEKKSINDGMVGNYKNFTEYQRHLIVEMYKNIYKHLERVAQLAIKEKDYYSTLEILDLIKNITHVILVKDKINLQAQAIIIQSILSLKQIGETALLQNMGSLSIKVSKILREISDSSFKIKEYNIALEASNAEINLNPKSAEALINKGDILNSMGEKREAKDAYEDANKIKETIEAYDKLVPLYQIAGFDNDATEAEAGAYLLRQSEIGDIEYSLLFNKRSGK
ncbi:MAG: hypothetical protein AWU59_1822 [Methanolobus sp. T82-4]|jgi:tetratricopeptide (TPR) repeat protein|nr:MAG: hypothetical protein AWU59_1822 [Methanolobus sp. T82-4]